MSSCLIQLDNYRGQYYAGSVIAGRVICSFASSKNIRGVKLKLKGEEENQWTETESYYNQDKKEHETRTVHYRGHNTFLHVENTLQGGGDLGPGRFEYPFTFQLPTNIPSTYQGRYGGVTFSLDAKVDRPFKVDYTDTKQIVVVSPINFNLMKDKLQLEPVDYSEDKTLCCWCCASGPITMEVHLDKEAFVVGEVVNVRLDITNMSNESIESISAQLGMNVKCRVTSPSSDSKSDFELLATDNDTGVGAHGQRTYNLTLEIPESAQVPNFNLCELFRQETTLKITAVIEGCHNDMDFDTEITMGHIPVHDPSSPAEQYPPSAYQPNMYPPNTYPPNTYPPNPVMPPYPPAQGKMPGPMGFVVPQGADSGPSAPPSDGGASAPSKREIAEQEFVVVGTDNPQFNELPPPSYNEAVTYPIKQ
ncbi:arrestin domain-containing protein 3 isoform X1 [Anoplophora glabripennis]|uniref:arrestin domain-containing protein 3 isoform X1 n=1 Tax=Anoplophora glabripennis TaxID=217634 RepID=UPI000C76BEF9|nr:arrestin domain-containing protein 3 isoform X1 [Anoplophora glabripennis]